MLLLEKSRATGQWFDSYVVVSCFGEDREVATNIQNELNVSGIKSVLLEMGEDVINDHGYWNQFEEYAAHANSFIVIFSEAIFEKENSGRIKSLWYEIGSMEMRGLLVLPFYSGIEKRRWGQLVSGTPIQQVQGTGDTEELIGKIKKGAIYAKSFYGDRDIALFGNQHIFYSKISFLVRIRPSDLDLILKRLIKNEKNESLSREDVMRRISRDVKAGVLLHRFGRADLLLHPYYDVYKDEACILNADCPRDDFDANVAMLSADLSGGCSIKIDLVIPNHEILGASFKPYLETPRNSIIYDEDIERFLESDCGEAYHSQLGIVKSFCGRFARVYFNFFDGDEGVLTECQDPSLGNCCNYVYPK